MALRLSQTPGLIAVHPRSGPSTGMSARQIPAARRRMGAHALKAGGIADLTECRAARRAIEGSVTIHAMTTLANGRIRHSVVFTPTHAAGSAEEADLLATIGGLAAIPGVEAFELMREVSPKNDYRYALTMEFANGSAYQAYNDHPDHVAFVEQRWDRDVAAFLEIDTVAL